MPRIYQGSDSVHQSIYRALSAIREPGSVEYQLENGICTVNGICKLNNKQGGTVRVMPAGGLSKSTGFRNLYICCLSAIMIAIHAGFEKRTRDRHKTVAKVMHTT